MTPAPTRSVPGPAPGEPDDPRHLPARLAERWRAEGWTRPGDGVIVACSGGVDSLTLLHLLRFSLPELGLRVEAAHFDHRMRTDSPADATWLRGLTGAWTVPCHFGRAESPPRDEGEARELRYRFLGSLLERTGAAWVLTAHHADDQIETILFRVLRGSGIGGLQGIPETRAPGVLRPLLPFSRGELEAYARLHRVPFRPDPSNRSPRFARNRIRHRILPVLEEVHPGARAGLLRIGRNAGRATRVLDLLLASRVGRVTLERGEEAAVLDLPGLLEDPEPVRAEIVRRVAGELGIPLSEAGTAEILEFIRKGSSGRRLDLPGSARLRRDFHRLVLERTPEEGAEGACDEGGEVVPLVISSPPGGSGEFRIAGRRYRVRWGEDAHRDPGTGGGGGEGGGGERGARADPGWKWAAFYPGELAFPLRFRAWEPGDRTRTSGGGKKLKKLFRELRVPREERHRLPVLTDGRGRVIWIPGYHRMAGEGEESGERRWFVGVGHVREG